MKKRLLFIVPHLQGAGVEKVLVSMINSLDKLKYDITVMSIIDKGERKKELAKHIKYKYVRKEEYKILGMKLRGVDRFFQFVFRRFSPKLLHEIFVRGKYDIEIDYWGQEGLKLVAGADKKTKKYAWIHTDYTMPSLVNAFFPFKNTDILKETFLKMDNIVAVSNDCKQNFVNRFNLNYNDSGKIIVKYNVNSTAIINEMSKEIVFDIKKPDNFLICAVGRLDELKGFNRLITISKKLLDDGFDFELWILGEGKDKEKLSNLIVNLELMDRVKLLGYKDNPYKYIAKSDLYVCSSYVEALSTTASEAVILGIPVVTTRCSGMKEIFGETEYGLITDITDDGLYEGMKKILSDKEQYDHYQKKVIERHRFFDESIRLQEIEKLFI